MAKKRKTSLGLPPREHTTVCIKPNYALVLTTKRTGTSWTPAYNSKALCGRVEDVRLVGGMQGKTVVIVNVRGRKYATPKGGFKMLKRKR